MEREPLDSIEYESTYLELRPESETLSWTRDASILGRRRTDGRADDVITSDAVAVTVTGIAVRRACTTSAPPADLPRIVGDAPEHPVCFSARPPSGPTGSSMARRCPGTPPGRAATRRFLRSGTLLQVTVLTLSTSLGVIAYVDAHAARAFLVALTGVLILAWARLAWRGTPRPRPFGGSSTRVADRFVTALGTFFAIALWARYAPQSSAEFSRTVVLVACGLGLMAGVLGASRNLRP
jgi:hypothetical protein